MPGNTQSGLNGRGNGLVRGIGGAGRALSLADIEADCEPLITIELNRLDLALAHCHGQAGVLAHTDFTGGRPLAARLLEDEGHSLFELLAQCMGIVVSGGAVIGHVISFQAVIVPRTARL